MTEQRNAFEAWISQEPRGYSTVMVSDKSAYSYNTVQVAWESWKEALQSTEVQTWKEDSERLDWIQEQTKQSRSGVGFDWRPDYAEEGQVLEMKGWRFMRHCFLGARKPNIREAIDHARRIEGDYSCSKYTAI